MSTVLVLIEQCFPKSKRVIDNPLADRMLPLGADGLRGENMTHNPGLEAGGAIPVSIQKNERRKRKGDNSKGYTGGLARTAEFPARNGGRNGSRR